MDPASHDEMRALEDRHWWFRGRRRVLAPLLSRAARSAPAGPLMDLGCGTGGNLAAFGELAADRLRMGVDREPAAVRLASGRGLGCAFVRGDGGRLPLRSGCLGLVTALDVLEHCADDAAVLAECARVLAPGGRLVASVPAYPRLWSRHDVALQHVRRYRSGELERRLEQAGFEVERSHGFNFLLLPLVAIVRAFRRPRRPEEPGPSGERARPATDFFSLPAPLEAACAGLFVVERALLALVPVPWGLSFMVRAVKPAANGAP